MPDRRFTSSGGKYVGKTDKYRAFIQDDEGDVSRGPVESKKQAKKRADDALSSSPWNVKAWIEEVK
jgi:hypothetical protein